MQCLILAGGFATRLYPLTINKAKALLEYRGKPNITQIVEKVPPDIDILISTNVRFVPEFLDWKDTLDRPVEILVEDAETNAQKKGAVSAIDFWIKNRGIREDLMIIAGDNYFEFDMTDLIEHFNNRNALIAVHDVGDIRKVCEIGKPCQFGLVTLWGDRIIGFVEKPEYPVSSIISTGIYILPRRIFPLLSSYCNECQRDNLGNFASYLLDRDEVQAYVFTETWCDIGEEIRLAALAV